MAKIEKQLDHMDTYSANLKREFTGLKALVDRVTVEEEKQMEKIQKAEEESHKNYVKNYVC